MAKTVDEIIESLTDNRVDQFLKGLVHMKCMRNLINNTKVHQHFEFSPSTKRRHMQQNSIHKNDHTMSHVKGICAGCQYFIRTIMSKNLIKSNYIIEDIINKWKDFVRMNDEIKDILDDDNEFTREDLTGEHINNDIYKFIICLMKIHGYIFDNMRIYSNEKYNNTTKKNNYVEIMTTTDHDRKKYISHIEIFEDSEEAFPLNIVPIELPT